MGHLVLHRNNTLYGRRFSLPEQHTINQESNYGNSTSLSILQGIIFVCHYKSRLRSFSAEFYTQTEMHISGVARNEEKVRKKPKPNQKRKIKTNQKNPQNKPRKIKRKYSRAQTHPKPFQGPPPVPRGISRGCRSLLPYPAEQSGRL